MPRNKSTFLAVGHLSRLAPQTRVCPCVDDQGLLEMTLLDNMFLLMGPEALEMCPFAQLAGRLFRAATQEESSGEHRLPQHTQPDPPAEL